MSPLRCRLRRPRVPAELGSKSPGSENGVSLRATPTPHPHLLQSFDASPTQIPGSGNVSRIAVTAYDRVQGTARVLAWPAGPGEVVLTLSAAAARPDGTLVTLEDLSGNPAASGASVVAKCSSTSGSAPAAAAGIATAAVLNAATAAVVSATVVSATAGGTAAGAAGVAYGGPLASGSSGECGVGPVAWGCDWQAFPVT